MSKIYFISDAHLGLGSRDEERAKEDRLIRFLDAIKADASQLFIVGDLFDAWIEYRSVVPRGFHRILAKLDELVQSGIAVHYLAGNHDFWMRDFFEREVGIKTHRQAFDITANGKRIFIHHGDGLSGNDTGYKLLKLLLQNRLSVWLYSWIHPDIGIALARGSSRKSRAYTSEKKYGEEDGMAAYAGQKLKEGFDIVIMGHRHRPDVRSIGGGTYINLGDWITNYTYAELNGDTIALKEWKER